MSRDYLDDLYDIDRAILNIEKFISGMSFTQFEKDEKMVFAVTRGFEIIGEAANILSGMISEKYPELP